MSGQSCSTKSLVGTSAQRPNWPEPIKKLVFQLKFVLGRQTPSGKVCRMIFNAAEVGIRLVRMLAPITVQALAGKTISLRELDLDEGFL